MLTGREASASVGARVYVRHRPERPLLYQRVEAYYPAFLSQLWGTAYDRKRRVTGGQGVAGTAHATMGAQLPGSAAICMQLRIFAPSPVPGRR